MKYHSNGTTHKCRLCGDEIMTMYDENGAEVENQSICVWCHEFGAEHNKEE